MISNITKNCLLQSNSGIPVLSPMSGDDKVQYILLSMCLSLAGSCGHLGSLSVNAECTQTLPAVIPAHITCFLNLAFCSES